MEWGCIYGRQAIFITGNGKMGSKMVMEFINLQEDRNILKEIGFREKSKGWENKKLKMEIFIKENLKTTKNMVLDKKNLLMEIFITEISQMDNLRVMEL